MGMLGLLKRIKLRFPRPRKPEKPVRLLSWEASEDSARLELMEEVVTERLADLGALDEALRTLN